MSVTFVVDEVEAVTTEPALRPLGLTEGSLASARDPSTAVMEGPSTHPLLDAVHVAFAQHRPLALSPDAVWLTIAQGVAQHVKLHADALRSRLVRHAGREELVVTWDGDMPADAGSWSAIVGGFRDAIAARVGDGRARLFECDFTTSGEVERVASQVVLMDAYSPYFDYVLQCICGIPEITLLGSVEDWRRIRARVAVIEELDLAWWTRALAPICDQLVRAAGGDVDRRFWRAIYKPRGAYGGDVITGWIARLFPYLRSRGTFDRRNPLLDVPLDARGDDALGVGMRSDEVPPARSCATVIVRDLRGAERRVVLDAGLYGIVLDEQQRVAPLVSWELRSGAPTIGAVIERIVAAHAVDAPGAAHPIDGAPAEIGAMLDRIGGARLAVAGGVATLHGYGAMSSVAVPWSRSAMGHTHRVTCFADLPDGTAVGYVWARDGFVYVRVDPAAPGGTDTVPLLGSSLAAVLHALLEAGAGGVVPIGVLDDAL
jgi:hypothetical protein